MADSHDAEPPPLPPTPPDPPDPMETTEPTRGLDRDSDQMKNSFKSVLNKVGTLNGQYLNHYNGKMPLSSDESEDTIVLSDDDRERI